MRPITICQLLFNVLILASCSQNKGYVHEDGLKEITLEGLEGHINTLASDEYQGRKPFTAGEEKTLEYLQSQFTNIGLKPGNGDSYLQEVPMVEITPEADSIMQIKTPKERIATMGTSCR